jgi:hypothetical protein
LLTYILSLTLRTTSVKKGKRSDKKRIYSYVSIPQITQGKGKNIGQNVKTTRGLVKIKVIPHWGPEIV